MGERKRKRKSEEKREGIKYGKRAKVRGTEREKKRGE